jgi:hypothetical protein
MSRVPHKYGLTRGFRATGHTVTGTVTDFRPYDPPSSLLMLCTSEEVCTRFCDRAVDDPHISASDVEAQVHEWVERQKSWRGGYG